MSKSGNHTPPAAPTNAQANVLRAAKFADGKTRNWSLFVFFRVLSKREMARSADLLSQFLSTKNAAQKAVMFELLKSELAHPRRTNPSKKEAYMLKKMIEMGMEGTNADGPNDAFMAWLKLVSSADTAAVSKEISKVLSPLAGKRPRGPGRTRISARDAGKLADLPKLLDQALSSPAACEKALKKLADTFEALFGSASGAKSGIDLLVKKFGTNPALGGLTALSGGLPLVSMYEVLRQSAVAAMTDAVGKGVGPAQSEAVTDDRLRTIAGGGKAAYDSVPSNYVFTYSGLEALQLDENTLRSFPDAFKQGMAARAEYLGDIGESAPEHWHGELGQDSVHGYFTGGFLAGNDTNRSQESQWRKLRKDIADFNDQTTGNGLAQRMFINGLFRFLGMEIVHLELAQDPYTLEQRKKGRSTVEEVVPMDHRFEHFGFRDGISQPFVDMKLGAPAAGGGTPGKGRSWSPVAAGEILLDQQDEDGGFIQQPANSDLREGGTYMVFRKLEQDVCGFRDFLAAQRPDDKQEQARLAAQFMGRWPNGRSLVHAPDTETRVGPEDEKELNNFLYKVDDRDGLKCPLGSHVRRTNPRDIDNHNDVRRHRILRRGMPYGGPMLPDGSRGDGEKRGLFFVCANSRIDLQFEVVQANWINKDAFSGQSGLGKCPITGANAGGVHDAFHESGSGVPVTRIPSFVINRGGDYFFAPGINALRKLAGGDKFRSKTDELPYDGESLGDGITPSLFDVERLTRYARAMTINPKEVIRVKIPKAPTDLLDEETASPDLIVEQNEFARRIRLMQEAAAAGKDPASVPPDLEFPVTFVARHADAKQVMLSSPVDGTAQFAVPHYAEAAGRLTRGNSLLVATEEVGPSAEDRARMSEILNTAWGLLAKAGNLYGRMHEITVRELNAGLARSAATGDIDLVGDLAAPATYAIVDEVFGVPGPDWITEMAISIPFARQHVGQIYPDWLSTINRDPPANRGRTTMQVWGAILALDIIGNFPNLRAVKALGGQAASELLNHLDILLANAAQDVPALPKDPANMSERDLAAVAERLRDPMTLLDAFVMITQPMVQKYKYSPSQYLNDVRGLLLEVAATPIAIIPANFANVMEGALNLRIDLPSLVEIAKGEPAFPDRQVPKGKTDEEKAAYAYNAKLGSGINRMIFETLRLNPQIRLMMRRANETVTLPRGGTVPKDDWVMAILAAANLDDDAFEKAHKFSLGPYDNGETRDMENYLLFGNANGARYCWGRDRMALYVMGKSLEAAAKLGGLTALAGPEGEKKELLRIPYGMRARFTQLLGTL